jgi:hypothetical protein
MRLRRTPEQRRNGDDTRWRRISSTIRRYAIQKDGDSSLRVHWITGRYEDVSRIYPAEHWHPGERPCRPTNQRTTQVRVTKVLRHQN